MARAFGRQRNGVAMHRKAVPGSCGGWPRIEDRDDFCSDIVQRLRSASQKLAGDVDDKAPLGGAERDAYRHYEGGYEGGFDGGMEEN